jgi:predicted Zn finger-like uncharacterized protein
MPIQAACPKCQTRYNVPDNLAGKRFRCQKCGNVFQVTAGSAPAVPDWLADVQAASPATAAPTPSAPAPSSPAPAEPPVSPEQPAATSEPAKKSGGGILVGCLVAFLAVGFLGCLGAGGAAWYFWPSKQQRELAERQAAEKRLNDMVEEMSKGMPADAPVPQVEDGKVLIPNPEKGKPPIELDPSNIDPSKLPDPTKIDRSKVPDPVKPPDVKVDLPKPDQTAKGDPNENKPIDLLKLFKVDKDAVRGKWTLQGETLISPPDENARLMIPYMPPEEYDIKTVAERKQGNDSFVLGLIAGGRQCSIDLDGWPGVGFRSGLNNIDGRNADLNETTYKGPVFTNGKPSEIVYSIRKTGITVTVDGKAIISYKGDFGRLSMRPDWAVPNTRVLFVGTFKSIYHVSKMELTPVSGKGEVLAASPDPKTDGMTAQLPNWEKVRPGMSYPEVVNLIGISQLQKPMGATKIEMIWRDKTGNKEWVILFDQGKVVSKSERGGAASVPPDPAKPLSPAAQMTQANYDKIEVGWTANQVKEVMGDAAETKRVPRQMHMFWRDQASNKEWVIVFEALKVVSKGQGKIGEALAAIGPKEAPPKGRGETKADQDKALAIAKKLGALYKIENKHVVEINLSGQKLSDTDMLTLLQPFTKCRELVLYSPKITEATFDMLKDFHDLEVLSLQGAPVTDKGLENLKDKKKLRILNLYGCDKITDAGLEHLKDLKGLKILMVGKTQVTDKGLEVIKGLKNLEELNVQDCKGIADKELEELKEALPNLKKLNSRVVRI